ncbi:MAG: phosphomannomutase/phosphoglucomutase, partial [Lachnospiraceae bacterium]|nr:phosphomannomutase/phosphoglucomutase [Lachnospiraceae bacterium]
SILNTIKASVEFVDGWSLAPDNFEGVRVNVADHKGNGWFLIRKSLHEPIMPLNIESDDEDGCPIIAKSLYDIIKREDMLNLQSIIDYIGNSL